MRKELLKVVAVIALILIVAGVVIAVFFPFPWKSSKDRTEQQSRIVIPQSMNNRTEDTDTPAELLARQEAMSAKIALGEGEVIVSVLNGNFGRNQIEEQFVAYRNLMEMESPIYITFIHYDQKARQYKRLWSSQTAASRPGTISLYTMDMLGDRSTCVLLSGMNGLGEHTLTIFRMNSAQIYSEQENTSQNQESAQTVTDYFSKIAEIRIDGNVNVKEIARSQAYQMGISQGESYSIATYGRDFESSNIMDQVEIIYTYNTGNGLYEQTNRTKIPGIQIEQRRVRELLGNAKAFETFIDGLWYYMTPQGTIDKHQYIFFNPANREIIFYGDETQQVFNWQNSAATRYGLYISSQNISVTTLRRSIDIELESLESIKVRVFEDVLLKIGVNTPWDGSYRKAGSPENRTQKPQAAGTAFIDAVYDSSIGRIQFFPNGSYEINASGTSRRGNYTFFSVNNNRLLELRSAASDSTPIRETYIIGAEAGSAGQTPEQTLTLLRARIGARGVERLHEAPITLTLQQ